MAEVRGRQVTLRRIGGWLLLAGLALMLAFLGHRVWSVWRSARPLLARLDQVQALAADPASADPTTLRVLLQGSHAELVTLRDEARPFLALASHVGWVPGIGQDLQALSPLLDIAVDLTGAGETVMDGLAPVLDLMDADVEAEGRGLLSSSVQALADARPQLESAQALLERAAQRRAEVDAAKLSPRLARLVRMLDRALPLAQAGVKAALLAPDLLGIYGPRTYLLLAQNSDELRPTGGFITGAGSVTVEDGDIVTLSFRDSYSVDDFSRPYDEPPAPLYEHMLSELWLFRDANWSPDFRISARKAAELYTYGQGVELDGVVAFDQQGAARLIDALGPIELEGWGEPITGENFVRLVRQAWNPTGGEVSREWVRTRKDFLNELAQAVLEQIKRRPEALRWPELGWALWRTLEERHLLIYLEEPAAASLLHAQGWDGALRPAEGDYLMVVDANLGFNKVNPRVERALDYQVVLHVDGGATATLAVDYHHTGREDGHLCHQHGIYREGERMTYESLMRGCYWNYLRVYVPGGSHLHAASRQPTPAEYLLRGEATAGEAEVLLAEGGKTAFAQFFVVERGKALGTRFCYDLPQVVQSSEGRWRYTLVIQKQPGTDRTPVSLTIALPPGAQLAAATPPPHVSDGGALAYSLELETDVVIEVVYELRVSSPGHFRQTWYNRTLGIGSPNFIRGRES